MRKSLLSLSIIIAVSFSGCATKNNVLFVTKTSLGIDFDGKPPTLSVAYDRTEGYVGPRYENGAVPPVIGHVQSDGGIFTAKIKQIYATGDAAVTLLTGTAQNDKNELVGNKQLMFFGTTTTTGLKVGFTGYVPDSFIFGYKRKEASFIPVGTHEGKDTYPSVLASVDNTARAESDKNSGLQVGQFFATGAAAVQLAQNEEIRNYFNQQATDAFHVYRDVVNKQNEEALRLSRCYMGVKEEKLPKVWEYANVQGLFSTKEIYTDLLNLYKKAKEQPGDHDEALRKANKRYASEVFIVDGSNPDRLAELRHHREAVCGLARE